MVCFPCRQYKLDCNPWCAFLEMFSQPNQVQLFEAVDYVFGFDKVQRMMQLVPEENRQAYIRSIVVEAKYRMQDVSSGFPGLAKKQIRELTEKAERKISQLQQEKSEMSGKISQLQQENYEMLGKILLLQREKEESKMATEEQILQLRQTLKEDFENYLIRVEQLFRQQATYRTTCPDEPALNLLDQEFAGACPTEPRVGVEQPRFIWAEQGNEQQPRPPVDLSFSLATFGSPHHDVIAPAVISDHVFSVNPSADEQHPSTSSKLTYPDLPPSGKRQRVNSDEEQKDLAKGHQR